MKSILHISDLHFGVPYLPLVGEALLELERQLEPSLTVCTGDIVQWAEKPSNWQDAVRFFAQLKGPYMTIPGNHDVIRLHPIERFTQPLKHYYRYIHPSRDSTYTADDLAIFGFGTPRGMTVELGFISNKQLTKRCQDLISLWWCSCCTCMG